MELQVKVDEADVGSVQVGQQASFTVSAWSGRKFPAQIQRVGIGSTTTDNVVTYKTVLKVANNDLALRPGMTATAEIITASRDKALLVPNAALRFTPPQAAGGDQRSFLSRLMPGPPREPQKKRKDNGAAATQVWVLQEGQPVAVAVTPGVSNGRYTEILGGDLQPGAWPSSPNTRRCVREFRQRRGAAPDPVPPHHQDLRPGPGRVPGPARRRPGYCRRGLRRRHGPQRLGQIHGDEHPRLPGQPQQRRLPVPGVPVQDLSRNQRALLRRHYLGFVFQGFNLLARTSAQENVELPLLYRGESPEARHRASREALARVGLNGWEHHTPAELSGGQQQRVAIARAIVTNPLVLLADEPTGNLDSQRSHEIMELLVKLNREQGITIAMVTHEPDMAAYASRIVHFVDGRVASDERTAEPAPCS